MQNIAPNVATFSPIPGANGRGEGHDLQKGQGKMLQGRGLSEFFRSSTGIQGKNFREGKVGRNNSTKIDNPIFGVLQLSPPRYLLTHHLMIPLMKNLMKTMLNLLNLHLSNNVH